MLTEYCTLNVDAAKLDRHPDLRRGMRRPATGDRGACDDDPEPAAGLSRLYETEASRIYPSARSGLRRYRSEAAAGLRCVRCAGEGSTFGCS